METVNSAFDLSTSGSQFVSQFSRVSLLLHGDNRANSHILERVLETGDEVGDEGVKRSLVGYGSSYSLIDEREKLGQSTGGNMENEHT